MFTSKVDTAARWDRCDFVALGLAVLTAVWVFALKLKTFYDLGYSGDLFVNVQLAEVGLRDEASFRTTVLGTSWLIIAAFLFSRSDL